MPKEKKRKVKGSPWPGYKNTIRNKARRALKRVKRLVKFASLKARRDALLRKV